MSSDIQHSKQGRPSLGEENRGFDPRRRRSSAMLRRSLVASEHQPYSLWPQARPRSESRFAVTPVLEGTERNRQSRYRQSKSYDPTR